jgi:hypothetical protein
MTLTLLLFLSVSARVHASATGEQTQVLLNRALHSVALVTLAVGPRARSFTTTLLQSYQRNADTDCPLYIVTEDVAYFDDALASLQRSAALDSRLDLSDDRAAALTAAVDADHARSLRQRVRFLQVSRDLVESDDPQVRMREKLERSRANGTSPLANNVHMRVKLLKTELLKLLPTQFEYALYVDSDMVIGQPLKPFLLHALRSMLDPSKPPRDVDNPHLPNLPTVMTLFPDIGRSTAPYHTGVVFLSRKCSNRFLRKWADTILTGIYKRDQSALAVAVERHGQADNMYLLPTDGEETRFFAFVNGSVFRSLQPYTFVHATMYRLTQPEVFGFTHDEAREYYRRVLGADYLYDFLDTSVKKQLEQQEVPKKQRPKRQKPAPQHRRGMVETFQVPDNVGAIGAAE